MEPQPRRLRTRPSIAEESGGEEILYPRNINGPLPDLSSLKLDPDHQTPRVARLPDRLPLPNSDMSLSPPSAFNQNSRRAKKRTSDEFEFDQTGSLVSKSAGSSSTGKDKVKDDKMANRKHRSLNVSVSSAKDVKGKDRRRDSASLTITSNVKSSGGKTLERDVRQPPADSTSSNVADSHHPRRGHPTDYSHLPPSPSSSSIHHFLRHSGGTAASQPSLPRSSSKDNLQIHPSVAHSLLRGTQEGWSALDDEALRKLDGLTGKGARARASVGSFGRPSSSSRPGTPASKSGSQWEGLSTSDSGKSKRASGTAKDSASIKDKMEHGRTAIAPAISDPVSSEEPSGWTAPSSDEQQSHSVVPDTTPKKSNTASARLSFTPKRGSTSSTTYTSTPSSRDSAFMSAATSVTSMSAASGRHSSSKGRRNSASSDISSVHSTEAAHLKDRVAFLAVNGDPVEDGDVPPVPPLPKDLSTYRSPPAASSALAFPSIPPDDKVGNPDGQLNRTISSEVPNYLDPIVSPPPASSGRRESQHYPTGSANESVPVVPKTPSKKWSFSSALNLKLSSSPSSQKSSFPLSPRSVTFGQQLRKSTSKDKAICSSSSKGPWSPKQPDAMASASSLVSLSSIGSVKAPAQAANFSKTPERNAVSSRPGTGSSVSTNHTTSALAPPPPGPLSPTSSVRRNQSKRLTPSSIPFFRRSSSQSMQLPIPPPNGAISAPSPTLLSMLSTAQSGSKQRTSPSLDHTSASVSTPASSHKKSSVLSLGLPSLLKSSSRRSLHSDAKDAAKEAQRAKDAARELEKGKNKLEKERQKKEDKERSESRISMIMNRKRGKVYINFGCLQLTSLTPYHFFQTLSSTDPRKPKSPVNLPPIQISALEPMTAQRVAKLKPTPAATPAVSLSNRASISSRVTLSTGSSMQKQSDTSLRTRNQLPTIAGSPSVGNTAANSLLDGRDPPSSSLMNSTSAPSKDTPTKIPRISSRTSAAGSPPLKYSTSLSATRRTSTLVSSANASPTNYTASEFGVMESEDGTTPKVRQPSVRESPSTSTSRAPRQSSVAAPTTSSAQRRSNRDSISIIGLRKSSATSVASLSTPAASNEPSHHRFSMLSPSKGLKLLAPKSSVRTSTSGQGSPPSGRQSLSTPSPVPSSIDEEELLGDEEMLHYIRRQHAKKLASGATQEELDEMLKFPEPLPPGTPSSPASKFEYDFILKSSAQQSL